MDEPWAFCYLAAGWEDATIQTHWRAQTWNCFLLEWAGDLLHDVPMQLKPILLRFATLSIGLCLSSTALAELNITGGADLKAFVALGQAQLDSGNPIPDEQKQQFEQFQGIVEAGLERVSFVVGGSMEAPLISVGLEGNKENIKGAIADPDGALSQLVIPDPAGGEGDFLIAKIDPASAQTGKMPKVTPETGIPTKMVETDEALYFGMAGTNPAEVAAAGASTSILPEGDRVWHMQTGLPEDMAGAIQAGIQQAMQAANQAGGGSPQVGQAMMMVGMAKPIIDDLSAALSGIGTMAFGGNISADGTQFMDFAQRRRDADSAASLGASLSDGSLQAQGISKVFQSMVTAPGVESKHVTVGDTVVSRMKWAPESMEGIGQAVMESGMAYFQQRMMGGAAPARATGQ